MPRRVRLLLLSVLLGVATIAVYWPAFSAEFIALDDADYVPENDTVKAGLRFEGLRYAFDGAHAGNWIPLAWLSHMADVELFGIDPRGHHATNVGLHVANALLLFLGLAAVTRETAPSFVVAAVFALHPVNVESVAWVSQRKTTLSTLFGLLAIGGYLRWGRTRDRRAYAASLVAYSLSLLSKQIFVPLPFALLLLDFWPLRRWGLEALTGGAPTPRDLLRGLARLVPEKLPYLSLALAASAATLIAQRDAIATGATFSLPVRYGNAVLSCIRYVGLLFWPAKLAVFYPLREEDVTVPRVAACALLLAVVTATLCRVGLRRRPVLVGWLWFLGFLVPVIGLVQVGAQALADRYLYVPSWGLLVGLVFPACGAALAPGTGTVLRRSLTAVAAVYLVALAILAHRQAGRWHDSVTLFESAVAADWSNFFAHRFLAARYTNLGQFPLALRHAEEGMKQPRDIGDILPIYGMALFQMGQTDRGVATLEEATRVAPWNEFGFTNLGWVQLQLGDPARAGEVLRAGLALHPQDVRALKLLAESQLGQRDLEGAEATLDRAIALAPLDFDARIDQARTAARLGRSAESERMLRDALAAALDAPGVPKARLASTLHLYLGDLLLLQGDLGRGAAEYEQAVAIWSDNRSANLKLAQLLIDSADPTLRDPARAVALAEHAHSLAGSNQPINLRTLAAAYAAAGRRQDAARAAREGLALARARGDDEVAAGLEQDLGSYEH